MNIYVFNKKNKLIKTFNSVYDASKKLKIGIDKIYDILLIEECYKGMYLSMSENYTIPKKTALQLSCKNMVTQNHCVDNYFKNQDLTEADESIFFLDINQQFNTGLQL